ncbi:RarD protein, DMT superfamily transporter [Desulfovibrio sp. X2]|uniref:EamA family transporter RarD n=1 Tax=Desulfovibrio sp. X2 TaxID=941449 RepID=UPI000358A2BC|nr:EamA family transporter RarD [Desulfovibrio sp. X2]EPR43530.1 RarD protein, DMT superfamily transporter [Desulfovibrio sp. X2]
MNEQLDPRERTKGYLFATAAFLSWGLLPFYWKALHAVPALEILCHRVFWSAVFTCLLILLLGRGREIFAAIKGPRTLLCLLAGSLLLCSNWLIYIWAVNHDHVVEASLGYYLTPLVNASLGMVVLGERLRGRQLMAVGLAAAGVLNMVVAYGHVPWVALGLALTFGVYGLLRKTVDVRPMPGLFWETALAMLPALFWLGRLQADGAGAFLRLPGAVTPLLVLSGVITALPLLWFAAGAKRMRLTTLGLFQYIAPTCYFLLGVFVFGEPFNTGRAVTFALIWLGILLYSAEGLMALRSARCAARLS